MDLHVFFLPFLAPGHMIPMTDLARLFAARGVRATVVTTTGNAHRIQPTIDRANSAHPAHPIHLLTLEFLSSSPDNIEALPTPDLTPGFIDGILLLEHPVRLLVDAHRPDLIVSDMFYPWTVNLGIPRIAFHGSSSFTSVVLTALNSLKPHHTVSRYDEPFLVPDIPHRVEFTRSQLPSFLTGQTDAVMDGMAESAAKTYGMVMNSFYELESDYAERVKVKNKMKAWHVGPVSLCHRAAADTAVRGGDKAAIEADHILNWLDGKHPGSVLYVCFGSLGKFTASQLREIASGLEASGHPFLWVVNGKTTGGLPEGFKERVEREGKGLVIRGWVPQVLILSRPAVGGFMTHCGWNSCLEGVSVGVPMITWPLFAEQFSNEKLVVDVLGIGISIGIGVRVCSAKEEERSVVREEEVRMAVGRVMGGGEEADGRRRRAKEVAEQARAAVEEGGSSYDDMSRLIDDLVSLKKANVRASPMQPWLGAEMKGLPVSDTIGESMKMMWH